MAKTFTVEVVPQVLNWLRTSAGWEIEEVAKKLGTSVEYVSLVWQESVVFRHWSFLLWF